MSLEQRSDNNIKPGLLVAELGSRDVVGDPVLEAVLGQVVVVGVNVGGHRGCNSCMTMDHRGGCDHPGGGDGMIHRDWGSHCYRGRVNHGWRGNPVLDSYSMTKTMTMQVCSSEDCHIVGGLGEGEEDGEVGLGGLLHHLAPRQDWHQAEDQEREDRHAHCSPTLAN